MTIQKTSTKLLLWTALGFLVALNQACATHPPTKPPAPTGDKLIAVPTDTVGAIAISKTGEFLILDQNGKRVEKCSLRKDSGLRFCKELEMTTVKKIHGVTILKTSKSPPCITIDSNGESYIVPVPCDP